MLCTAGAHSFTQLGHGQLKRNISNAAPHTIDCSCYSAHPRGSMNIWCRRGCADTAALEALAVFLRSAQFHLDPHIINALCPT